MQWMMGTVVRLGVTCSVRVNVTEERPQVATGWKSMDRFCDKNIEMALMKTKSRAFRTSDWAQGSAFYMTMTLSTQQ